MALHRLKDFDVDYRDHFDGDDIIGYDVYSDNDKIGSVDDLLVEDDGRIRYLIVNTGLWVVGKKVLLPIGRARIEFGDRRIYAKDLTKSQVESLPQYDENSMVDYEHEEQVRDVYRPTMTGAAPAVYDRDSYDYGTDADLYDLNEHDHSTLRLYQERLIASKIRQKVGEVTLSKHIETETAQVSVPIEKERIVIERVPVDASTVVTPDEMAFREGEVTRLEVYEEVADVHKEAFVREEVRMQKVVDQDTVTAQEQVRREELDVTTEGHPTIEKNV